MNCPCRSAALVSLLVAQALFSPPRATAQRLSVHVVHELRTELGRYDAHGYGTTSVLADMTALVNESRDVLASIDPDYRDLAAEVAFLRAAAAADLLLLAHLGQDPALRERVAQALEVSPEQVGHLVLAELDEAAAGPFAAAAREPAQALASAELGTPVDAWVPGPRLSALFVARVGHVLATSADPIPALPHLVEPCEEMEPCPEPYVHFDTRARRALRALTAAYQAANRVQGAAESGDGFAVAALPLLETSLTRVSSVTLRPEPVLEDSAGVPTVVSASSGAMPDFLVVVGTHEVRFSRVPTVWVDPSGVPRLYPEGGPALPEMGSFRLPFRLEGPVEAHDRIGSALAEALPPGASVAITASAGVPAHLLSRVLLSATEAGRPITQLAGRRPDGLLAVAPFRAHRDVPESGLRILVRLGGYTIWPGRAPSLSVDRVRVGDDWHFDPEAFGRSLPASRASGALRYMKDVDAALVVDAAFRAAPAEPLALVVR